MVSSSRGWCYQRRNGPGLSVLSLCPMKQQMEEARKKADQQFEKNKCSLDLLTHRMLTCGHPGLTGHYDERQAGKQHQTWLNSCFLRWSHPEVTSVPSTLLKRTLKSGRHHPGSLVWSEEMPAGGQEIPRPAGMSTRRTPACSERRVVLASHLHRDLKNFVRTL